MSTTSPAAGRVLVVDDESSLRRLLRVYLVKAGFDVVEARDGQEALFEFERSQPDVAIVDVMLPELDGFEVVRRIRARSSTPVILLTAKSHETDRVTGLELGRDAGVDLTARGASITVRSDVSLIETIVDNLVSNALRYGGTRRDPRRASGERRPHRRS